MKVMISGSINYLALYSASGGKVWVFGVKLIGDGSSLRLVKCAVIDCRLPISSISLSFGFLILGEMRGVRVFPLRVLVKGRVGSKRRLRVARGKGENSNAEEREIIVKAEGQNFNVPNGDMKLVHESYEIDKSIGNSSLSKVLPNGYGNSVLDGVSSSSYADGTVKLRSLKFRQDSGEWGMQFFLFNDYVLEGVNFKLTPCKKTKAISIQAISKEKFLILDSNGVVHVLHVSNSGSSRMRQLTCTIQVQHLAAFPDASADSHYLWMSDGLNSVHVMVIPNSDTTEEENDKSNNEGEFIQSSVTQVIFTSESVQDMVPLAANRVLVLGQDSVCAYGIS
ncbi:uncharacterized protein LOC110728174 [Chenopodium quinoa]|uniref:uncharacterized protein LOC110728174 n=1 Tax=Chenopodium quinoa TaxID=63459 RepID=UPI000B78885C|nr:uncharacterized protein LOC110728174 [Chenopodium quinoa]XP_021763521.1 uncharacterized protein LOC110728174 [Chenopodium quinoa]XP_021763522.1 uncharacterized protein LOC110728174 [Chenopodium quinoa]